MEKVLGPWDIIVKIPHPKSVGPCSQLHPFKSVKPYFLLKLQPTAKPPDISHFGPVPHQRPILHHRGAVFALGPAPARSPGPGTKQEKRGTTSSGSVQGGPVSEDCADVVGMFW